MGAGPQGNWSVPIAIVKLWQASSIDEQVHAVWQENDSSIDTREFNVLNDTEARAGTPWPYVVFEMGVNPVRDFSDSGGEADTRREVIDVPFEFRTHAKTKPDAASWAKRIVETFTRHAIAEHMVGDKLVNMQQLPDFPVREGDTEWSWVVPYLIKVDRVFDAISAE